MNLKVSHKNQDRSATRISLTRLSDAPPVATLAGSITRVLQVAGQSAVGKVLRLKLRDLACRFQQSREFHAAQTEFGHPSAAGLFDLKLCFSTSLVASHRLSLCVAVEESGWARETRPPPPAPPRPPFPRQRLPSAAPALEPQRWETVIRPASRTARRIFLRPVE
jgi:hypothetical protein